MDALQSPQTKRERIASPRCTSASLPLRLVHTPLTEVCVCVCGGGGSLPGSHYQLVAIGRAGGEGTRTHIPPLEKKNKERCREQRGFLHPPSPDAGAPSQCLDGFLW